MTSLQDKHHLTNIVCFKLIYYKPRFLWVWEDFQHDLYLLKCQDQYGVGGDLRLSCMSAPWQQMFAETKSRRGKTGGEEEKEQDVIHVGVDCWLTLTVSHSHFSLPSPHSAIYLSVLSLLLSLIVWCYHFDFPLLTHTHKHPPVN